MTQTPDETPDVEQAAAETRESRRRAQQESAQAREAAAESRSVAERLRALREDNGFERIFDQAFGGGGRRG